MLRRALPALLALLLAGCGSGDPEPEAPSAAAPDQGPVHIHGLGVDPADGSLYVATHTGLFRAGEQEERLARVGDDRQDTMGFTIAGEGHFLGSGHPDERSGLPPFLGLIESRDAGETWEPVSLLGEVDFHVLEALGERVYGFGSDFESREARFLVSDDGGREWSERTPPEPVASLAIDPEDPDHVVASGEDRLHESRDGGRTWRPLAERAGMLAWAGDDLHLAGWDGRTARSADGGRTWQATAAIAAQPAAFAATGDSLLLALHDGRVIRSLDGGRTWEIRATP